MVQSMQRSDGAGSVTFLRILGLAATFEPSLIVPLAVPMTAMAVSGLGCAAVMRLRDRGDDDSKTDLDEVANPLNLGAAVSFGALLTLVLLVVHYFEAWFGTAGVPAASALSGVTDVGAITISVAQPAGEDLSITGATVAIFLAVAVNTVVKAGIAIGIGGKPWGCASVPYMRWSCSPEPQACGSP